MQAIEVVTGGQFGSEAKGHVTAQLVKAALRHSIFAQMYENPIEREVAKALGRNLGTDVVVNVRVAGPNAGHTVYDANGVKFAFRQLPVGAVLGDVTCYIAPGSEIDLPVLLSEVEQAHSAGHRPLIFISGEATMITDSHKEQEGALVGKIGSTGKGIGAARADRLLRGATRLRDDPAALEAIYTLGITLREPNTMYSDDGMAHAYNQHIIVEGTQGFGLGLHAGFYPQCTSSNARAIDFLAMAGLDPMRKEVVIYRPWVVFRPFPIRVAGNSGPLVGETTWEALGLPEERTTVTQKVRRVGTWDESLAQDAVQANGGSGVVSIALSMVDQVIPALAGAEFDSIEDPSLRDVFVEELDAYVKQIEESAGARVSMVTTSPSTALFVNRAS